MKNQSKFVVVLITSKDMQEAKEISSVLLNEKLAACVNIVGGLTSMFWWEGKIDKADETLLIVKTKESILRQLIKTVKSVHSYTSPEIIALPIIGGSSEYLKWVNESVKR